ncbi:MAG: shikimate kinase [Myxococcota bacterium]|jgi:shikimate kinase
MGILTLVGAMGSGKSTVARKLSKRWSHAGYTAIDLDRAIEERTGAGIPLIFAVEGEAGFRRWETETLRAVLDAATEQGQRTILSLGGGTPCQPGAMDAVLAAGPVIWLKAPAEVLARRALGGAGRPLLAGMDLPQATRFLEDQLVVRAPFYERAHLTLDAAAGASVVVSAITQTYDPEIL